MTALLLLLLSCNGTSLFQKDETPKDEPKDVQVDDPSGYRGPSRLPEGKAIVRECYGRKPAEQKKAPKKSGFFSYNKNEAAPEATPVAPSVSAPTAKPSPAASQPAAAPVRARQADELKAADGGSGGAPMAAMGYAATGGPAAAPDPASPPAEVPSGPLVLKMLGTKGEDGEGSTASVQDLLDEGSTGQDLASALKAVSGGATSDSLATKEGTGRGDASIGELSMLGGGTAPPPAKTTPGQAAKKMQGAKVATSEPKPKPKPVPKPQPVMDWGGTTYLSNDDSMSLASAQRLLWAVKNGKSFRTSEVRPHELLNYFSFDTAPVAEGEMFSVLAAAQQTDADTLSVALAVKGATPPRMPLDLTLVVDRSGSMSDEGRMDYVKRGLEVMRGSLKRGDRVDLVLFDDELCVPLEDFVVGRDDDALLKAAIDDMKPRGSTDMNAGLQEGYRLARTRAGQARADGRNQRLLVLTDALLNTGEIRPDIVTEIGKAYDESGVRLTGIGVGREFNDKVLDQLTEKGKGAYVYLGSEAVVDRVFGAGFEGLTRTIAHNVRFALDLPESLAMERFYGEESSTRAEDVQPINYYSGTTQVFLQDLKIRPGWIKDADPLVLTVTYTDATTGQASEYVHRTTVGALYGADPRNLRKARALMGWTDLLTARAMRGDPCGKPLATWTERTTSLQDDAEIAYVNSLVGKMCPTAAPPDFRTVAYKVRVNSDSPIAEVAMECQGNRQKMSLTGGQTVVTFNVPPGSCALTLEGTVPMNARVKVPETGGQVQCMIRGGRVECT